jgi:hypothetical protein
MLFTFTQKTFVLRDKKVLSMQIFARILGQEYGLTAEEMNRGLT